MIGYAVSMELPTDINKCCILYFHEFCFELKYFKAFLLLFYTSRNDNDKFKFLFYTFFLKKDFYPGYFLATLLFMMHINESNNWQKNKFVSNISKLKSGK